MEIIFAKLPKYFDHLCFFLVKLGYRVYYLELSYSWGDTKENRALRVSNLKTHNIVPLPIEDLPHIDGISELTSDPDNVVLKKTQQIAPLTLLDAFGELFPDIPNITNKLQIGVHSTVLPKMLFVAGKVNIWAHKNHDTRYLLIDLHPDGFFIPDLASNVKLLVIPLDIFANGLNTIIHTISRITPKKETSDIKPECPPEVHKRGCNSSRVALVTHHGLNYGNLFPKYVFYSPNVDSEFHCERLLHIDYSGWTNPSENLNWVCMGNHRQSRILNFFPALTAISKGILHIRRFRHILGLIILVRIYVIFRSFSTKLESYPDLKMALIDYEILCPNELLLAFESNGIKTVAVQERFFTTFSNLLGSTILNYYLCDSKYTADVMKFSPLYSVDHFLPVGQYRSDKLDEAIRSPPPNILEEPLAKGQKIITALGFHAVTEWQNSQVEPYINWKAHKHFLCDMIRLSEDIPDAFIILRYKDLNWISLPVFSEDVQKINSIPNMKISMDYDKFFVSYDLCAHSDLVIAKPTSIADECLSVGIPVLFHEYTHNTERIIADAFDYSPARIMCYNYQDLKERTQIILSGTPNEMTADFDYLKREVYGGFGDGKVTERIHAHIEKLLLSL